MIESMEELLRRSKAGDKNAGEQLIVENSGLVWSIAKRYFGRGVDADDLYQLGCLGFLKAIEGYDPDYGTQFSTYAVPKIAGEIRRFLRDDGTVKVSRSLKELSMKATREREIVLMRYGLEGREELTQKEVAQKMGISQSYISRLEKRIMQRLKKEFIRQTSCA